MSDASDPKSMETENETAPNQAEDPTAKKEDDGSSKVRKRKRTCSSNWSWSRVPTAAHRRTQSSSQEVSLWGSDGESGARLSLAWKQ